MELQEAKRGASEKKLQHVLSSTCVYDLPDLAWTEPACVFRGHLPTSQLPAKKSGQSMTNKLAAQQGTRHSELQVDTGPESLTAWSTVVSVGSASFGGTSLGASMVQQSVPRRLPAFNLAYEENFKELVKEDGKTNLPQLSPVTSLTLNSLQLQSVGESLSLTLRSLPKMLSALLVSLIQYPNLCFQLQSLQQQELARSAWATASLQQKELAQATASLQQKELAQSTDSLQQKELAKSTTESLKQKELVKSTAKSLQLSPTRARELQPTTAQLCSSAANSFESVQQKELANFAWLKSFPPCPTRAFQLQSFQLITVQLCFPNQLSVDQLDALQESFAGAFQKPAGFSASAFQDPGTAATATAAAFCTAAACKASRLGASKSASTTTPTMTTTTTTTPRKPSFHQKWAQKHLAPQPGSFISNFQGELQQSTSAASTRSRQEIEELEEQQMLAKHLAELVQIQEHHRRQFGEQLKKVQDQLRKQNIIATNFDKHNSFTKRAQELEKYCEELTKIDRRQKSKMHRQLSELQLPKLDHQLSKNSADELTTNNDNENELVHYNLRSPLQQQLPTVTFKKKKEQLDNLQNAANFYSAASKTKLQSRLGGQLHLQDADSALGGQLIRPSQRASTGAAQEYTGISLADSFRSRIDNLNFHIRSLDPMTFHIRSLDPMTFHVRSLDPMSFHIRSFDNSSLSTKALDSNNFSDTSFEEETFRQAISQKAAWQKRASDRQLLRQQLRRRDLQNGNFDQSSLEEETFEESSFDQSSLEEETFSKAPSKKAAWHQRPSERPLQEEQLDRRDLQQDSFQDSSLTEEPFSKTTSQKAAWQKRASDRQLLRQQLGRRELQQGNFRDSSLEESSFEQSSFEDSSLQEETFSTAASKKAASERHFASAWQTGAWQLSLAELQTRTLTPELSQLERTALHTELAELERPALTTELAQLQPSSLEASFPLGGGSFKTSPRRGGVLRACLPPAYLDLELDTKSLTPPSWLKLRPLEKFALQLSKIGLAHQNRTIAIASA